MSLISEKYSLDSGVSEHGCTVAPDGRWSEEPVGDERRATFRAETSLTGHIIFNNRRSLIECEICDVSEGGAKIKLAPEHLIPYEFEFEVPEIGLAVRARVMWTNASFYGLSFIGSPQGSSNPFEATSKEGKRLVAVSLSGVLYKRLQQYAHEQQLSPNHVMQRALLEYLDRQRSKL